MDSKEKLKGLRNLMKEEGIQAYIVPSTDPHNSEYLPDYWKQREWISGFKGSFGYLVVTMHTAALWTDSRYFIQAEKELSDSGIELIKMNTENALDVPTWLIHQLSTGDKIGFYPYSISVGQYRQWFTNLDGLKIVFTPDLVARIWTERPALSSADTITLLDKSTTGSDTKEKLNLLRKELEKNHSNAILLSALDEIAWVFNIRSNDIKFNPVVIAYAYISMHEAIVFIDKAKLSGITEELLKKQGVSFTDYEKIEDFIGHIERNTIFALDPNTLNYGLWNKIESSFKTKSLSSPVSIMKAVKNPVELEGMKKAALVDGIAMTRFLHWLESELEKGSFLNEFDVSRKLTSVRAGCRDYISNSFENISAYGPNAALPHYSVSEDTAAPLYKKGLYLVDSGAHYPYGTTDITRTIPLGVLSEEEKSDYTLVLKGMIRLSMLDFPAGTSGCNMDIVARKSLWDRHKNYGHGTGHGVGFYLNVHEGPQAIRQELKEQPLLPGMITSNEPGIYIKGRYGIRHENLIICIEKENNEFGKWYGFESLTLCYFDTSAILKDLLTSGEIRWLNNYHKEVYEKLSPHLEAEEKKWLKTKTLPI